MKVLITGGAGYIGQILVRRLLEFYEVTILDDLRYRQTPFLDLLWNNSFNFVRGDVRDLGLVTELVKESDVIIPLAAIVGMPACDRNTYKEVNSINKESICLISEIVEHFGNKKLIYPCTNSGYGMGESKEGGLQYCTEETPLNPISLYGTTKVIGEKAVIGAGGVSLRLATVFGASPSMRPDLLVNDFVERAYRDRSIILFEHNFKRNYIHVKDVAKTFEFAIVNYEVMQGESYNVGLSTANLDKLELCEKIKEQTPFTILTSDLDKDPDQRNYIVSNKKLEDLGWHPIWSLEDGIKELLKAYKILDNINNPYPS